MVEGLGHWCDSRIMKPLVLPQLYQEDEGLVKETGKGVALSTFDYCKQSHLVCVESQTISKVLPWSTVIMGLQRETRTLLGSRLWAFHFIFWQGLWLQSDHVLQS